MSKIISDTKFLHPKFSGVALELHKRVIRMHKTGRLKTRFEIFETFRDPLRQMDLLTKGVTKAGKFQSAHQFGLAVDLVPVIDGNEAIALSELTGERHFPGWSWHSSHEWEAMHEVAKSLGLVTISWDKPHVEHPQATEIINHLKSLDLIM